MYTCCTRMHNLVHPSFLPLTSCNSISQEATNRRDRDAEQHRRHRAGMLRSSVPMRREGENERRAVVTVTDACIIVIEILSPDESHSTLFIFVPKTDARQQTVSEKVTKHKRFLRETLVSIGASQWPPAGDELRGRTAKVPTMMAGAAKIRQQLDAIHASSVCAKAVQK